MGMIFPETCSNLIRGAWRSQILHLAFRTWTKGVAAKTDKTDSHLLTTQQGPCPRRVPFSSFLFFLFHALKPCLLPDTLGNGGWNYMAMSHHPSDYLDEGRSSSRMTPHVSRPKSPTFIHECVRAASSSKASWPELLTQEGGELWIDQSQL